MTVLIFAAAVPMITTPGNGDDPDRVGARVLEGVRWPHWDRCCWV